MPHVLMWWPKKSISVQKRWVSSTSTCDLTPTTLSPPTIQTGHGWWCQLMGWWVSWPIKGGLATSIFWKSGTVHRPRSLLNPDELTLLKLPHSVGQPIWSSIQWTINLLLAEELLDPQTMWISPTCQNMAGVSWNYTPGRGSHCKPKHRWDWLNFFPFH